MTREVNLVVFSEEQQLIYFKNYQLPIDPFPGLEVKITTIASGVIILAFERLLLDEKAHGGIYVLCGNIVPAFYAGDGCFYHYPYGCMPEDESELIENDKTWYVPERYEDYLVSIVWSARDLEKSSEESERLMCPEINKDSH